MRIEDRRAARLLVIDARGRVLLFRHPDPGGGFFWATPGGGLEPGESFEQAARREAKEELDLVAFDLVPAFEREVTFPWGDRTIRQEETYFLFRVEGTGLERIVTAAYLDEGILESRWWTLDEIERSASMIRPHDLAARLRGLEGAR